MPDSYMHADAEHDRIALVQSKLAKISNVVGREFLPLLVQTLAEIMSTRWVLLCAVDKEDRCRANAVVVWDNGPSQPFSYDLQGTPCENIVGQGPCSYPRDIRALFPQDSMLKTMGAESYVGAPLRSSAGETLGLLAVLDQKELTGVSEAEQVIGIFAGRAAAELERIDALSLNERLGRIVEDSASEVYLFDGQTYRFKLANRGARDNLGYSMDELRNLTPWDIKPEYSAQEFKDYVAPLLTGRQEKLTFETVHQRKDGSLYDVAVQLQYFADVDNLFFASIIDVTERKKAQKAQAYLAALVMSSSEAIISKSLDGIVQTWNVGACKIFGFTEEEMVGHSIRKIIPPDRQNEEDFILARIGRGELVENYETIRQRKDGTRINVAVTVSPVRNSNGEIIGASKIAHDITERKLSEQRERILMREVNHRSKNLLSMVQVIARQSLCPDPEQFVKRFDGRIQALASSHDLLVHSCWSVVSMREMIMSQLGHFADAFQDRIAMEGTDVNVFAEAVQPLGMALHELATNAAKYGALSNETGRIDVSWKLEDGKERDCFQLSWKESGGPAVAVTEHRGFGSTVIERLTKAPLRGQIEMEWLPEGLTFLFRCPSPHIGVATD